VTAAHRVKPYASLANRNFRLFFSGQLVSSIGTWLHQIAEVWLVLQLTGDGFAVGAVTAARFVPILTLGLWAGAIADRHDKRRVLYLTQTLRAASAGILGALALSGSATVPVVLVLAALAGIANAIDNPVRRAFIGELVDDTLILNAVSLNSTVMATSRVAGPLLAGVLIATIGVGWCFIVNAVSYAAVLVALAAMDQRQFDRSASPLGPRSVLSGLRYAASTPALAVPLVMVGIVSTFAWNWETLLALHATRTFDGGARMYTLMFAVLSVGTLAGALLSSTRSIVGASTLLPMAAAVGASMLAVSVVPGLALTLVTLLMSGFAAATFNTTSNAVVQIAGRGEYHGRVMAMFSILFIGTKGIGGALAGALMELLGTRWAIAISGGSLGVLAAMVGVWSHRIDHEGPTL